MWRATARHEQARLTQGSLTRAWTPITAGFFSSLLRRVSAPAPTYLGSNQAPSARLGHLSKEEGSESNAERKQGDSRERVTS